MMTTLSFEDSNLLVAKYSSGESWANIAIELAQTDQRSVN